MRSRSRCNSASRLRSFVACERMLHARVFVFEDAVTLECAQHGADARVVGVLTDIDGDEAG